MFHEIIDLIWEHEIKMAKLYFLSKASDLVEENSHFSIPLFNHLPAIYHQIQKKKNKPVETESRTSDLKKKQKNLLAMIRMKKKNKKKGKKKKKRISKRKSEKKIIEEKSETNDQIEKIEIENNNLFKDKEKKKQKKKSLLLDYEDQDSCQEKIICVMCQEPIDPKTEPMVFGINILTKNFRSFVSGQMGIPPITLSGSTSKNSFI